MANEDVLRAAKKALDQMLELIDSGTATKEDVQAAIAIAYRTLVGKFAPIIQAIPSTLPIVGAALARVVSGIANLLSTISENAEMNQAMSRFRKNRARVTFENYQAYRNVGFGRIASMVLVVADKKSTPFAPKWNSSKSSD